VNESTARLARHVPIGRRPAAVIFDMDGLMLDTEPLAARAWGEAATALGVSFDMSLARTMIGRNFADCATMLREHYAVPHQAVALRVCAGGDGRRVDARDRGIDGVVLTLDDTLSARSLFLLFRRVPAASAAGW